MEPQEQKQLKISDLKNLQNSLNSSIQMCEYVVQSGSQPENDIVKSEFTIFLQRLKLLFGQEQLTTALGTETEKGPS